MRLIDRRTLCAAALLLLTFAPTPAAESLQLKDVFHIEYASDPQVSPDGKQVVYVRNFMDIKKDRPRSHLWVINVDGSDHRPLTSGEADEFSPRWSPDGKRLLYVSDAGGSAQLHCRWMDRGDTAQLTRLPSAPATPAWSPDGKSIAFTMLAEEPEEPYVELPGKPEGAEWAKPPRVYRGLTYRFDGKGYLKSGHYQLFVVPAEGGAPRQLTRGPYDHLRNFFEGPSGEPSWSSDGKAIIISANRHEGAEHDVLNTDVYEVSVADGGLTALTDRKGPDEAAVLSPDGKRIVYSGFEDKHIGYQMSRLSVMNRDGSGKRVLNEKLDREAQNPVWAKDGSGLYVQYTDGGNTKVGFLDLEGRVRVLAENVGGTEIGRPYTSGSFSVGGDGVVAFTLTDPSHPADVAVRTPKDDKPRRLTSLNDGWLRDRALGSAEEVRFKSSFDQREIQGWVVKPPHFDPKKKYPLILEIHGGPQAEYGPNFAAEIQLYAAAGYVVLYTNPRGSTGYGEAFTQLINGAYPGNDYDDLMSGVDELLKRGYVEDDNLFVTGGSGGGILTAWVVGKTKRFRAAVAAKAIVNWYSGGLTSDGAAHFIGHWFARPPWESPDEYLKLSPISLVGNVTTPTMLLTGEEDYRCPISEAEQFYTALKLRKVDTALVRIPEASHAIVDRPSRLMAKVACILKWFDTHKKPHDEGPRAGQAPADKGYDVILRGGTVYDGSGDPPRKADVALKGDRVAAVGDLSKAEAKAVVDAGGLAVAPGFINMLSWSTDSLLADGRGQSEIRQGVTTQVMGEGNSWGPVNAAIKKRMKAEQTDIKYDIEWNTLGEYLYFLQRKGVSQNVASYLGATTVREYVIGLDNKKATPEQMEQMRRLVEREMRDGALGIASALEYAPAYYADTDELIELCKAAAKHKGKYISHMRSEGERLLEGIDELIRISREAKIPAEIYHFKAAGKANWKKMDDAIAKVEAARRDGLAITANMYGYTAGAAPLTACVPPWAMEGGEVAMRRRLRDPEARKRVVADVRDKTDWPNFYHNAGSPENVLLISFKKEALKPLQGKTLAKIAKDRGKDPVETLLDLLLEDESGIGTAYFITAEENIRKLMPLPWVSFGSDEAAQAPEGVFLKSLPHPRAYGNFARVLGKYVRDEKLMTLEAAVRKLTSLPATNLGLDHRGLVKEDYFADVVVFDPKTIADRATYEKPHQYAVGVKHVFVNGVQVLKDGEHTGAKPGRALWGPGRAER